MNDEIRIPRKIRRYSVFQGRVTNSKSKTDDCQSFIAGLTAGTAKLVEYRRVAFSVRHSTTTGTAVLGLRWEDVGSVQPVSFYMYNRSDYFFACRILAVEYKRSDQSLSVHFDVRGEADLVPPSCAKLFLGLARDHEMSCIWAEASTTSHELKRVSPDVNAFVAEPIPGTTETMDWTGPSAGPRGLRNYEWEMGNWGQGKRCNGHVTFGMKDFDMWLSDVPPEGHSAEETATTVQVEFVYSTIPAYTPAILMEWPVSERVSISEALSKYPSGGGEHGVFAEGDVRDEIALSEGTRTIEYARERSFAFVPEATKSRPEWWA